MESTRQQKIARLIQKELGVIFQQTGRELFSGSIISVTKVYISKDLAIARIYLSLFTPGSKKDLLELIHRHAKEIRFQLGQHTRSQLRIVPELHFLEDDSLDYIDNIDHLLHENP